MVQLNFQNPAALGWLVPLSGVIIALYLLKMRRQDVRIPASFLWPSHTEEIRANSLFQRLRFSWLLVLQLLTALLFCLALARPQVQQKGLLGTTTVLILDHSASMNATDVSPNRLAKAKQIATESVNSAGLGDQIAVISSAGAPKVVSPLSNDHGRHRLAISQISPTDTEGDMAEALRLAAALVGGIEGSQIVILSDGCFPPVTDFARGKANVVYRSIGAGQENLAIQALGASKTPRGTEVYCGVKNFGLNSATANLNIYADDKLIFAKKMPVASLKGTGATCLAPASTKLLRAELDNQDLLLADNKFVTAIDPNSALSVLLISKGDPFLERALLLDPRVSLDSASELPLSETPSKPSKYDLIIFDGVPSKPVGSRAVLNFVPGQSIDQPKITKIEELPLTDNAGYGDFFIDSAARMNPPSEAKALVLAGGAPIVAVKDAGQKTVWVAFEPMNSDFPLQVGFPIFISNVLDFVAEGSNSGDLVINTGRTITLRSAEPIDVRFPDGSSQTFAPNQDSVAITGLTQAGQYRLGKNRLWVNLRSDIESNIAAKPDLELGRSPVKSTQTPTRLQDLWRYVALLVVGLLAFEWWLYARKS